MKAGSHALNSSLCARRAVQGMGLEGDDPFRLSKVSISWVLRLFWWWSNLLLKVGVERWTPQMDKPEGMDKLKMLKISSA